MTARALALVLLLATESVRPAAAEPVRGLAGLARLRVDVEMDPSQTSQWTEELARRIAGRLGVLAPALTLDPTATDRLRLTVTVRRHGATALRGFWLPFSGTYGIGPVRLSVERTVTMVGGSAPVAASVWHAERQAAGPWRESPKEIVKLLDEMLAEFLEAYRRR